jgi:hypothetical protein
MEKFNPNLTTQNITNSTKKNDNGNHYEEIYYEIVAKNQTEVTSIKTCVFFENGFGICLQSSAEQSKFQSDLLDATVSTAKFYEPIINDSDSREHKTYINDSTGFEFEYPKNWRIEDGFSQGLPQVTLSKQGSKTFGMMIVEVVDPSLNFDFQKYLAASLVNIQNMKQLTQGQCDSHNIQRQNMTTSSGFNYECVEYELVDPLDSTKILTMMKQNVFFENDHGYVVQTCGPPNEFDPYFMNEINEHIKFKTPKSF